MVKDVRLENFEASFHLAPYEVYGERWSLGALDRQVARRTDDAKLIPERAARLDLSSLRAPQLLCGSEAAGGFGR